MSDLISRQAVLKHIEKIRQGVQMMDDTHRASIIMNGMYLCEKAVMNQPSAQHETEERTPAAEPDFTEMKQEFHNMASYIEMLLECSEEQKEILLGYISRLSEFMPWTKEG